MKNPVGKTSKRRSRESGFATIYVLLIGAAIAVILTTVFVGVSRLHQGNMKQKSELKARAEQFNAKVAAQVGRPAP